MLANPEAAVRRASAEAIGLYTKPPYTGVAKSAIKPLIKALRDPDGDVRLAAERTLKAIDPIAADQAGAK
jgi:HEAT repeat protein